MARESRRFVDLEQQLAPVSPRALSTALKGAIEMYTSRGNHIVTLQTEHKAVLDTCKYLERTGAAEVTYLEPKQDGLVDLEELKILPESPLVGQSVRDTAARQRHNLLIVGIRRAEGAMLFNPAPEDCFEADDTLALTSQVLNDVPPRLAEVTEQTIPAELDALVAACLEKSRDARPESILAVKEILDGDVALDAVVLTVERLLVESGEM